MTDANRRSNFESVQNGEEDGASARVETTTESSPSNTTGVAKASTGPKVTNPRALRAERAKVIARMERGKIGLRRPLESLAVKEAAIGVAAAALPELSRFRKFSPDELLFHQLTRTIGGPNNGWERQKVERGALYLYSALRPIDAIDSIRARNIVGLNNATMNCFERAERTSNLAAQNLNLRYGTKGAEVLGDLLQQYENRGRTSPQNVTVGEVNVGAGGQAIVGNLETGERRISTRGASTPRKASPEKG